MKYQQDLIWMCVKNNSAFIRKNKNVPTMSAEQGNLTGLNKLKYSGLAHNKAVSVDSKTEGKKETIMVTNRTQRGKNVFASTGMSKGAKSLTCPHAVAWAKKLLADEKLRHEACDAAFKSADADGSGDLSPGEVITLIATVCKDLKLDAPPVSKIKELVEKIDKNKDGSLSLGEFRSGFLVTLKSCVHKAEEAGKKVKTMARIAQLRPDLSHEAAEKYAKVKKSFKKKKVVVKSRRAKK
mmetsp:Transcript_79730/g.140712  ORF Transcript_79730/g.140712 Transcript_79730/m.140712 type:complete len:239 (-) Transcript_79730:81-797(-)